MFGCVRNKQTSVSHSSTESEVISLDACLRMDGISALDPRGVVIEVLHSSENTHTHSHQAVRVVLLPSGGHTPGDPADSASSHLIPLEISGIWLLK